MQLLASGFQSPGKAIRIFLGCLGRHPAPETEVMTSGQALLHVVPFCVALLSEVLIKAQVLQSWASCKEVLVD